MTRKIKTAVVGLGYLGSYHAQKYLQLPHADLIAVCDVNALACEKFVNEHPGINFVTDYQNLINKVNAVSIAVPTHLHYQIAAFFLKQGIHVLLEKPITTTIEEADALIALAKENKAILQIGHLERYNNAVKAVEPSLHNPRFIESLRLAPFKLRGTEVNVVLDLMIHDIDIIQSIVKSNITRIFANGASVLSPFIDIANARIEFANGCVANVTASRVSLKTERKLRIFQHDSYIGLDLDNKKIAVHRKGEEEMFPGIPKIMSEEQTFEKGDALLDQIADFLNCIIHNKKPLVGGEEGKRALATAIEITQIVKNNEKEVIY